MTKRDMLLRTLRREGMHGIPCDMAFTPPVADEYQKIHPETSMENYFDLYYRGTAIQLEPGFSGDGKSLFRQETFPSGTFPERFTVDVYGIGMAGGSEAAYHMVHFHSPLEGPDTTEDDIASHPMPLVPHDALHNMESWVGKTKRDGYAAMAYLAQTIWERSWLIRGMNDLMMDMAMDDPRASMVLDLVTEHSCMLAEIYAKAGFDIMMLGDDIGMQLTVMMSVPMWRAWLKPRLARVIRTIKKHNTHALIYYHSCGFIEPFIPDLIELGVDILNPLQPESMDISTVIRTYGDRLSFWGGVGTQTTLPFGSPRDVHNQVFELIDLCRERGGLVVGPTHVVEPEVPWENLEAFRDAIMEARSTAAN